MNAKEITITILLALGGIAAGIWLRGASDQRGWTEYAG